MGLSEGSQEGSVPAKRSLVRVADVLIEAEPCNVNVARTVPPLRTPHQAIRSPALRGRCAVVEYVIVTVPPSVQGKMADVTTMRVINVETTEQL